MYFSFLKKKRKLITNYVKVSLSKKFEIIPNTGYLNHSLNLSFS